ncbi:hypothetical protein [Alkalihalobacillus sp. LMS39]|uniref:TcaA NTF2-like domain-containing protein n=1 Tax=Alkalihalobacillus sp. LMS39 TaxID=2924032 RepID=UPI001FB3B796|nr:hypothetical protein [Alkalihalobacillus sp. LMS39]UOE92967.1 hypothetical protein MM271_17325 [Alkalihalobacillus sp. LMS39]
MRQWKQIIILVPLLLLFGCNQDIGELTSVSQEEEQDVAQFIVEYKEQLVDAVNGGKFNDVEPYLVANTTFYHAVRRYVSDLQDNSKTLKVLEQDIGEIQINEHGEYYATVIEVEETTDRFGHVEAENLDLSYVLYPYEESFRLITIIKNK